MSTKEFDTFGITKQSESQFFRCKRHPDASVKKYVNEIYESFGYKQPRVKIYEHPGEVPNFSDNPFIDVNTIGKKIRDIWVKSLIINHDTWEQFERTRSRKVVDPDNLRKKISFIYSKMLLKYEHLANDKALYNENMMFFINYVTDYLDNSNTSNSILNFINSGILWFRFDRDTAHILRVPIEIVISNQGELHSDNPLRPAVKWGRGEPECFLWNEWFEPELWDRVVNHKIDAKQCIAEITNIEQRTKALRVVGYESVMKPEYMIDEEEKTVYTWDGNKYVSKVLNYQLYSIPDVFKDLQNDRARSVELKFTYYLCPSTNRKFYSTVDPIYEKVMDAMGSKYGMDADTFRKMQIES